MTILLVLIVIGLMPAILDMGLIAAMWGVIGIVKVSDTLKGKQMQASATIPTFNAQDAYKAFKATLPRR